MRNARELHRLRVENIDYDALAITVPDSKTESGTRSVPLSDRVSEILRSRSAAHRDSAGSPVPSVGVCMALGALRSRPYAMVSRAEELYWNETSRNRCHQLQ
jgi:integrase